MRLGVLVTAATFASSCASAPETSTTPAPSPEEQLEQELVAARRPPPPPGSSASAPWRPAPRGPASDDSGFAACRSKIGPSLSTQLAQRQPSDARPIPVSAEFQRPQEDDAYPGLRFVGPVVAIGELDPAAIGKLCESAELKWIDAAPKSFLSR